VRVYLPSTLRELQALLDTGTLGSPPLPAYAVTPQLREWYAESEDLEELEYAALSLAARASVRLLDADQDAPRRRVVVVAEVEDVEPVPKVDRAAVRVLSEVPLRLVGAVHVDAPEAEQDVAVAADAVVEADLGGEDAAFRVEQAEGHELLWYATQEIGPLLELG
jgi:hypothetical protein